ncbi:MAG TPA: hypothetical protein VG269_13815 [Tepidisphaeraceae bacterium]|jgi:hypothetical protein|nr:hypothetical protein [Tepidisphaeraceae bacterium]
MNCDDFLTASEAGGFFDRRRARRHAANCPRCAALLATFAAVKREMASPPPLTARERHLWKHAAEQAAARPSPLRQWVAIVGGLAAVACVTLLVVKIAIHKQGDIPSPIPIAVKHDSRTLSEPTVTEIDPAKDLAQLSQATDRLDAELVKLRQDAQRRDARRQVAMAFEHFDKW